MPPSALSPPLPSGRAYPCLPAHTPTCPAQVHAVHPARSAPSACCALHTHTCTPAAYPVPHPCVLSLPTHTPGLAAARISSGECQSGSIASARLPSVVGTKVITRRLAVSSLLRETCCTTLCDRD